MNEVEIHVSWKDDNGKALGDLRAKAKKGGGDAGDDWSGSFSGTLSKGAVKAVEKTAKDAEAKAKPAFEKTGEEAGKATAKGFEKGAKDVDKATEKVAKRTQAQFSALAFAGLSLGLPAAAAAGAVGAAAALTIADAAFVGIGITAAKSSETVQAAWLPVTKNVVAQTQQMSQGFESQLVTSAQHVQASFTRMAPEIQSGLNAAAGSVVGLTDAATGLAERALPGLVTATRSSGQAIDGLGSFAKSTGSGVSDMFTNMSHSSTDAGAGMAQFGGITRDLLGFTGTLVSNLAANHDELGVLSGALNSAESAVLNLTTAGSGAIGFLHGFGQAGSGTLAVISGLSAGLSALPPQVTQFGGSITASSMILSRFGVDAGAAFDGVGAKLKNVGSDIMAAKNPMESLKTAGIGLVQSAFNPAVIATVGLSIVLDELGRRQQEAAAKAQEHKAAVSALTDALKQDGGVIGNISQQTIAKSLADKNAAGNANALGVSLDSVQRAAVGNGESLGVLSGKTNDMIQGWKQSGQLTDAQAAALQKNTDWLIKNGGAANTVVNDYGNLTGAQRDQLTAVENLVGAVGDNIKAAKESHDAYVSEESALTGLNRATIEARDAEVQLFGATQQLVNSQLGLRGAVLNTQDAQATYDKTMGNSKSTVEQKAKATLALEQAEQAEILAAQKSGEAASAATSPQGKQADGMHAATLEAIKLADAFKGPLPASLQETISRMGATELRAAGLKVGVDNLGHAVVTLPNGKTIQIVAETQAARDAVNGLIRGIDGRVATIHVNTQYGYSNIGIGTGGRGSIAASGGLITHGGVQRFAKGGQAYAGAFAGGDMVDVRPGGLLSGPGTGTSDDITARVSNGEFVVKASQTRRNLPLLKAINNGQDGFASGGPVKFGSVSQSKWDSLYSAGWRGNPNDGMEALYAPRAAAAGSRGGGAQVVKLVVTSGGSTLEQLLAEFIRNYVRVQGGNVQNVFGR